ncbi:MAG: type II toxin-antitoxin system VapC family toxin [Beijerinckiaceae bacterium]
MLLDTHILIWLAMDETRLSKELKERIAVEITVSISVIARWEVGIKAKNGRFPFIDAYDETVSRYGFNVLPITDRNVRVAADLPLFHRDPFDRMLVAQAICENLTLVTADAVLAQYPCRILLCGS